MKFALALSTFFFLSNVYSQTGGVVVSFDLDPSFSISSDSISVQIWKDSTLLFKGMTVQNVIARELPAGKVDLYCAYRDSFFVFHQAVYIQNNQLVYTSFEVDSSLLAIQKTGVGKFSYSDAAIKGRTTERSTYYYIDGHRLPTSLTTDMLYIEEVQVMSYRTPLINRDGGSCCATITREDITRLPSRTAYEIAPTVGGVNATNDLLGVNIRGARAGQNAYYIDGMRVNSLDGIPKAFIQNTQVITGGVPACYGDATGGIILVEGKSLTSVQAERRRSRRNFQDAPQAKNTAIQLIPEANRYVAPIENQLSFDKFSEIYENDFLSPLTAPNSTFGVDVDQASWTYIKTMFSLGQTIHRDAVKLEEMLNSFKHAEVELTKDELIGVAVERSNCAWNPENELVTIRVRAADMPKDQPRKFHNIVLLVDVSGSMSGGNKLPLLVQGFKDFVKGLEQGDRISIVTYAGQSGVALKPTTCDHKETIYTALSGLVSGGSTNGIGGITTAYELAEAYYNSEFNNRIILATDGDFNVGISSTNELEKYISKKRGKGIYLTALGFGMGNYRNDILETLADRGDGNHFYINDLSTCDKVLSGDIGNLINIARDVKLNVEFNPVYVTSYRLIGYENRLMPAQDFANDQKDGGEMGYGHSVIAVYEITREKETKTESHFTQTKTTFNRQELAFVKLRYKPFEDSTSIEQKFSLEESSEIMKNDLVNLVAGFGLMLRNSVFKGEMTNEKLIQLAKEFKPKNEEEIELKKMILSLD